MSSLIISYEMKNTADKLDRRIKELELIVAIYSGMLEFHKEKKMAESTTNSARSKPTPRQKEVLINGSTG